MLTGLRYRAVAIAGTLSLAVGAVGVANHPAVQSFVTGSVPVLWRLRPTTLAGSDLFVTLVLTAVVVGVALVPLYKPRPRRTIVTLSEGAKRVLIASFTLAAVGYYDYTYRLPRATLVVVTAILVVAVPTLFAMVGRRPETTDGRTVVVGDDPVEMAGAFDHLDGDVVGYVAPPSRFEAGEEPATDGGSLGGVSHLGGLSRLESVLIDHDVDTAVLAFPGTDRAEFFGTLEACFEHGVRAKVPQAHGDSVLASGSGSELVDIDLEPWDWQDYVVKRAFDCCFAVVGLVALAPVLFAAGVAIKLDDGGPVLYSQERTAEFGETFRVYKLRTMRQGDGSAELAADDDRVTRVGRVLRRTHLDETPQLLTILLGNMSVVGPRATWTDEEHRIEDEASSWRKRWFVKPGLTGLAQVNGATSVDPKTKLQYDLRYIRNRTLWLDVKIVLRQLWLVAVDVASLVRRSD